MKNFTLCPLVTTFLFWIALTCRCIILCFVSDQIFSHLIVIDFESTCWREKNNYSQEISKHSFMCYVCTVNASVVAHNTNPSVLFRSVQLSFLPSCSTHPQGRWSQSFTPTFSPKSTPFCRTSAPSWPGLRRYKQALIRHQHASALSSVCSFPLHCTASFLCPPDASWGRDPPSDLPFSVQPLAARAAAQYGCGFSQQTTDTFCALSFSKTVYLPHLVRYRSLTLDCNTYGNL